MYLTCGWPYSTIHIYCLMHLAAKSARSLAYGKRSISLISQCTILQQKCAYAYKMIVKIWVVHCGIWDWRIMLLWIWSLIWSICCPWAIRVTSYNQRGVSDHRQLDYLVDSLFKFTTTKRNSSVMLIICETLCDVTVNFPHTDPFSNAQRVCIHYKSVY